jgi:hypothetical protein
MPDLPPAKRRKTLTDSIISTAFSAALIGTAVGMTAYRMYAFIDGAILVDIMSNTVLLDRWRDRGKPGGETRPETVEQPPPPYLKEEWVDDSVCNRIVIYEVVFTRLAHVASQYVSKSGTTASQEAEVHRAPCAASSQSSYHHIASTLTSTLYLPIEVCHSAAGRTQR